MVRVAGFGFDVFESDHHRETDREVYAIGRTSPPAG